MTENGASISSSAPPLPTNPLEGVSPSLHRLQIPITGRLNQQQSRYVDDAHHSNPAARRKVTELRALMFGANGKEAKLPAWNPKNSMLKLNQVNQRLSISLQSPKQNTVEEQQQAMSSPSSESRHSIPVTPDAPPIAPPVAPPAAPAPPVAPSAPPTAPAPSFATSADTIADQTALVVGAGPVGLLLALLLYEVGFCVVLVESRTDYTRKQIIQVDPYSAKQLQRVLGQRVWIRLQDGQGGRKKIVESLGGNAYNICISDLELVLAIAVQEAAQKSEGRFRVFYGCKFLSCSDAKLQLQSSQEPAQVARHKRLPSVLDLAWSGPSKPNTMLSVERRKSLVPAQMDPLIIQTKASLSDGLSSDQPLFYEIDANILIGCDSANSEVRRVAGMQSIAAAKNSVYANIVMFSNQSFYFPSNKRSSSYDDREEVDFSTEHPFIQSKAGNLPIADVRCVSSLLFANADLDEGQQFKPYSCWFQQLLSTDSGFYFSEELSSRERENYACIGRKLKGVQQQKDWCIDRARSALKQWRLCDALGQPIIPEVHPDPELIDSFVAFDARVLDITLQHSDRYALKKFIDGKPLFVFLAGDSAHTTHFLTGSGWNQGVQDVLLLTQLLQEHMRQNQGTIHSGSKVDSDYQEISQSRAASRIMQSAAAYDSSDDFPPPPAFSTAGASSSAFPTTGMIVENDAHASSGSLDSEWETKISEYNSHQRRSIHSYHDAVADTVEQVTEHSKFHLVRPPISQDEVASKAAYFNMRSVKARQEQQLQHPHPSHPHPAPHRHHHHRRNSTPSLRIPEAFRHGMRSTSPGTATADATSSPPPPTTADAVMSPSSMSIDDTVSMRHHRSATVTVHNIDQSSVVSASLEVTESVDQESSYTERMAARFERMRTDALAKMRQRALGMPQRISAEAHTVLQRMKDSQEKEQSEFVPAAGTTSPSTPVKTAPSASSSSISIPTTPATGSYSAMFASPTKEANDMSVLDVLKPMKFPMKSPSLSKTNSSSRANQ